MRIIKVFGLCLSFWMGTSTISWANQVVYLSDFSNHYRGSNITLALHEAIAFCKEVNASKLIIPYGEYEITPDYATERYVWVSNNDEGLKRFAFDLTEMEHFEVDGQGAHLLFSGFISPFLICNSKHITISNLSIDYVRTFHSEGEITALYEDGLEVQFSELFPYKVEQDLLYFYDTQGTHYPYSNLLEFDPEKRETAFMAKDYWLRHPLVAKELGDGKVRIYRNGLTGVLGNVLVFGAANRHVPGFILSDSEDVTIRQVNIYHCGGMGVIAQRCRNIELNRINITPAPGSERVVSITADATHFVQCGGFIRMINCLFEQQKDDATNIHGIYAAIVDIAAPTEIIVKLIHTQQYGFELVSPGDKVELVAQKSLMELSTNRVKSVETLNKEYMRIEFEETIPADIQINDVIAPIGEAPEVLVKGCIFRGNRARGLLLGSRGKMVIEENYFHVPGAAILFEGDGNYWFEQSGVRNVVIRGNLFHNCNYGVWGNALFQVGSGIYENREESRYHRNIVIENNTILAFDPRLVNIYSVDGFLFRNNTLQKTNAYPTLYQEANPFVTTHCDHVTIKEKP